MSLEVGSVFVTGANRGIGLEFVRQIVKLDNPPKYVFATFRNKDSAGDLEEIQRSSSVSKVIPIQMDVTKDEDVEAAKKVVENTTGGGIHLLINNAGALTIAAFPEMDDEYMLFHFKNNTLGPIKVLKGLLPLLQQAAAGKQDGKMSVAKAAVINISSMGGSIECIHKHFNTQDLKEWVAPVIGYRTSKASLNMAMRIISYQVKEQGVLVVNMCPGWVRTDMGTDQAQLSPEESISAMLKTFSQLNESHSGSFMDRNGETIPF